MKLTEPALRVLHDEREDQTEKLTLIRDLALRPSIHKKLREQFPDGIKSDASAVHFLMFEEGYNKQAASELVTQFKATAEYAGIFKPGIIPVNSPQNEADEVEEDEASIDEGDADDPPSGHGGGKR